MTMIDPAIVPQRTLYTGAKMPAVGMGTFGSDHADADAVSASADRFPVLTEVCIRFPYRYSKSLFYL